MSHGPHPSEPLYEVVVNQEGQYSIWLASEPLPEGWTKAGKQGPKASCLAFISTVWTDMRPTSLGAGGSS